MEWMKVWCQLLCCWNLAYGLLPGQFIKREDLKSSLEVFSQPNVRSFSQLLLDIQRYQLIVGSRDHLFRLSLEGLKKMEEDYWPAEEESIQTCQMKGKSEEDCMNYIKVLLTHNNKLFTCGTNAFKPQCSWRDMNSLKNVEEWVEGEGRCPHNPHANSSAVMTSSGDYYVASTIDFTGQDPVIFKGMGSPPLLRTVKYDPKWLSNPNFIASYDIDNFTYYFFREAAVEYINCGKVIYSRVARICKNDPGGQFLLKDRFTTFLKARLNCSVPGNYPFYYNEIQSVYYIEKEEIFYATFTTPVNSIYGTAVCAFNLSSINNAFNGAFKYQKSTTSAWERQTSPHKHFQCATTRSAEHFLESEKYQLMNEAVQPITSKPILQLERERLSHVVVDTISTKESESVHVMFVSTVEGWIRKIVILPQTRETCVIETIQVFPDNSHDAIKVMKLSKDMKSLYIGTEESVLRILVHRCERFLTKSDCLSAMDPYCGWNEYKTACTVAPHRSTHSTYWLQDKITCPRTDRPVHGGWSAWGGWFECSQTGVEVMGDRCRCQKRACNNPEPAHGGRDCEGTSVYVSNCTRDGQWTEWSSWSSCSQSCGSALKSRRRVCGNPSPAFGGKICIGPERDEIYCTSNPPCPSPSVPAVDGHWSDWSTWETCSERCGGGVQVRRRRCNSPPPQRKGGACAGCNQDFRFCNIQACPEVRKSSAWTPYFRVNATHEGHYEQRLRFQCRANVADESMLRVGHVKKEERFCKEGTCLDSAFVSVDGGWSAWSSWSLCSATCGGGVQFQDRKCDSPKPTGNGADCVGSARMDRVCNTESCQDLKSWEEWSEWSECDSGQEQHRQRKCKLPTSYCAGASRESRMCIPTQFGANTASLTQEDGVHAEHVVGAFICGLITGTLLTALGIYFYLKRRFRNGPPNRVATQLIPVSPNTYVSGADWKNNYANNKSPQKIPLREATIKRNGTFRAQLQSDHF